MDRPAAAGWDQPLLVPTRNEAGLGALIDEGEVHLKAGGRRWRREVGGSSAKREHAECLVQNIALDGGHQGGEAVEQLQRRQEQRAVAARTGFGASQSKRSGPQFT